MLFLIENLTNIFILGYRIWILGIANNYFIIKIKVILQMITEQPVQPSSFCFKYFINLGNGRFGSMTINEKTNLYQQAQTFCKLHQLDPNIAVYLQNEMFQQVLHIKQQIRAKQLTKQKSIGKISKNNPTQNVAEEVVKVEKNFSHCKDRTNGSILHQSINYTVTPACQQKKANKNTKKPNIKHFEEMFKRHEQIESKKQLSRKASIEKIPFKPVINSLSRKIVDLKRNSTSNFMNCSSQRITVYRDGKQNERERMHGETTGVAKSKSKTKIKQIKIRIQ